MAESKGIDSDLIPGIATGFCGGVGRTCGMCGALSGGIMAIGILYGRNSPDESVNRSYQLIQKFKNRFETKFGTSNCKELTGCDLGTEEGQEHFISNNLIETCQNYTREATEILMSLLEDES